jgi:hypothetical protein
MAAVHWFGSFLPLPSLTADWAPGPLGHLSAAGFLQLPLSPSWLLLAPWLLWANSFWLSLAPLEASRERIILLNTSCVQIKN